MRFDLSTYKYFLKDMNYSASKLPLCRSKNGSILSHNLCSSFKVKLFYSRLAYISTPIKTIIKGCYKCTRNTPARACLLLHCISILGVVGPAGQMKKKSLHISNKIILLFPWGSTKLNSVPMDRPTRLMVQMQPMPSILLIKKAPCAVHH